MFNGSFGSRIDTHSRCGIHSKSYKDQNTALRVERQAVLHAENETLTSADVNNASSVAQLIGRKLTSEKRCFGIGIEEVIIFLTSNIRRRWITRRSDSTNLLGEIDSRLGNKNSSIVDEDIHSTPFISRFIKQFLFVCVVACVDVRLSRTCAWCTNSTQKLLALIWFTLETSACTAIASPPL